MNSLKITLGAMFIPLAAETVREGVALAQAPSDLSFVEGMADFVNKVGLPALVIIGAVLVWQFLKPLLADLFADHKKFIYHQIENTDKQAEHTRRLIDLNEEQAEHTRRLILLAEEQSRELRSQNAVLTGIDQKTESQSKQLAEVTAVVASGVAKLKGTNTVHEIQVAHDIAKTASESGIH